MSQLLRLLNQRFPSSFIELDAGVVEERNCGLIHSRLDLRHLVPRPVLKEFEGTSRAAEFAIPENT